MGGTKCFAEFLSKVKYSLYAGNVLQCPNISKGQSMTNFAHTMPTILRFNFKAREVDVTFTENKIFFVAVITYSQTLLHIDNIQVPPITPNYSNINSANKKNHVT